LRHNFLLDQLELQRKNLVETMTDADGIIEIQDSNTAARPSEPIIPTDD
jgi:hypothetical protein